jgi:hypothetical protein
VIKIFSGLFIVFDNLVYGWRLGRRIYLKMGIVLGELFKGIFYFGDVGA